MNISWHDRDLYSSLCLLAGLAIMESESGVSFIFLNACSAEIALGPTKARSSAALVLLKVRTLPRRLRIPSRFPVAGSSWLDQTRCHWPLGEVNAITTEFCGGAAVPGRRYCPHHLRMARYSFL